MTHTAEYPNTERYKNFLEEKHRFLNTPNEITFPIIERITKSKPISSIQIVDGEMNEVQEIITNDQKRLIVRISRTGDLKFKKEKETFALISSVGVSTPNILSIENISTDNRELSFCIEEKAPGESLAILINKSSVNNLSPTLAEVGNNLAKIHDIKAHSYGDLLKPNMYFNWHDYMLSILESKDEITTTAHLKNVDPKIIDESFLVIKHYHELFSHDSPDLLHGDFCAKHIIIDNGHVSAIIDMGNPKGGDPIYDLAWWNYFCPDKDILNCLKNGYSEIKKTDDNFDLKITLYKLAFGLDFIRYYYKQNNSYGIDYAKVVISKELENLKNQNF